MPERPLLVVTTVVTVCPRESTDPVDGSCQPEVILPLTRPPVERTQGDLAGEPELIEVDEQDEFTKSHTLPFANHQRQITFGYVFEDVDGNQRVEAVFGPERDVGQRSRAKVIAHSG